MPSLKNYKLLLSANGKFSGQAVKTNADNILEASWYNDVATRTCYLFDYYHDPQPLLLNDLTPDENIQTRIDIRYIVSSSQTFEKDAVTYHIMLKPSEEGKSSLVNYYDECFKYRYDANFPCGLYILIPDSKGKYNKWLIVGMANYNDPQFPTYEVLRCDKLFQWIYKNKKYQMCGVLRSQNSYNSGIWEEYKFSSTEDVQKMILPLNRDTESLFYNLRMIIDNKVLTEPRAWKISKVNRLTGNGLTHITLAQDMFDQNKDYIEKDIDGNIIGMWADYYEQGQIIPEDFDKPKPSLRSEITYSGTKPEIKINGSYKKFTIHFYEEDIETEYHSSEWSYGIRDGEIITPIDNPEDLLTIVTHEDSSDIPENQIKVKFDGDDSYIGKVLIITNTASINDDDIISHLEVEIKTL